MQYDALKKKYSFKEQYITVDENKKMRIFVRVVKEKNKRQNNAIPLLFIPGGPGGDGSIYFSHIPALIQDGPLILFDPRGTGKSDKHAPATFNLNTHIRDIEVLRKALGFKKMNIYGASYGGVVAQGYTLRHQQHVNKLILGVTVSDHHFFAKAKRNAKKWAGSQEELAGAMDILHGRIRDEEHFVKVLTRLAPLYSREIRKSPEMTKSFPKFPPGAFSYLSLNNGFAGFLRKLDYTKRLHKIKVPTMIISGKYDWICDVSFGYIMHQKIENSQLHILPGGHNLFLDCNKMYCHLLQDFLDESE